VVTVLRRFLVLAALMFWTGGFTFYAAVVVPVGAEVLGSHREQGYITQQVTKYMNLAGAAALPLLAWDAAATGDPSRWRRRVRWLMWLGMALTLAALACLHPQLDTLLGEAEITAFNARAFRPLHRTYLWTSTIQWGFAVLFTALALGAWRAEDRVHPAHPA
jgi:hypothetical protein